MAIKSEPSPGKIDVASVAPGLLRFKLAQGKGQLRIVLDKKHGQAGTFYLEINGTRKFEIGNDCDTCHFWFKCVDEPRLQAQKKIVNLPKTVHLPRPVDESLVRELEPLLDLLDKGEYSLFETTIRLGGPYDSDDESSYFFNTEFLELWDIADPKEEGFLSGWEHYEGERPRIYRPGENNLIEKQFEFIIPLVPRRALKEEHVKLYQSMISQGDRPRILLLGFYQRAVPEVVKRGQIPFLHSFLAGFVLDGHHKLAAYRRSGIGAKFLVLLSHKASKFHLLKEEGALSKSRLEERLATLAA